MFRSFRTNLLYGACFLVAACGGDSGSGTSSTTAPVTIPVSTSPASPTATPAPAPTPTDVASNAPTDATSGAELLPSRVTIGGLSYDTTAAIDTAHFGFSPTVQTFTISSGSHGWSGDVTNGNERVEIVTSDVATKDLIYAFDQEFWLSYAIKIEPGDPITSPWNIVGQIHDWHDPADISGLSPPLSFVMDPTSTNSVQLSLWTRSDSAPATLQQVAALRRWRGTFTRGQWIRIVLRVRPSYAGTGTLQLWINGTEVLNASGNIDVGYNNPSGLGYWQYGIYRKADEHTTVVHYANMEQSRASLINRVSSPLDLPQ